MLKITISASLLKTVSSSLMAISSEAAIQQKEHPFVVSQEKKKLERRAKMWKKSIEEIIKEDEELAAKYPSKSLMDKLPLISNIKAYTDKVFKVDVDATSKELTIQINEDFISEAIKIGTNVTIKAMEPFLNLTAVFVDYTEEVDAYTAKWKEDEEENKVATTITSETIPAEKVPSDILNSTVWSSSLDEHPSASKPFFTDEEKENYETVEDLRWTRGSESFRISPQSTVFMLKETDKTVAELAEYYNIPSSLVRTIYAHYKVKFTPKQLGLEEIKVEDNTTAAE